MAGTIGRKDSIGTRIANAFSKLSEDILMFIHNHPYVTKAIAGIIGVAAGVLTSGPGALAVGAGLAVLEAAAEKLADDKAKEVEERESKENSEKDGDNESLSSQKSRQNQKQKQNEVGEKPKKENLTKEEQFAEDIKLIQKFNELFVLLKPEQQQDEHDKKFLELMQKIIKDSEPDNLKNLKDKDKKNLEQNVRDLVSVIREETPSNDPNQPNASDLTTGRPAKQTHQNTHVADVFGDQQAAKESGQGTGNTL